MTRASISDALALLGEEGLDDHNVQAKQRFRDFLHQPKWQPDDFAFWIAECLKKGGRDRPVYYYALQDIIVTVGVHLGMEVEYGSYSSYSQEAFWDGRWFSANKGCIVVEAKASTWPTVSVHQLGGYLDTCVGSAPGACGSVHGVYVICRGPTQELIAQIKGSEYRSRLKVISCDDLIRLWKLKNSLQQAAGPDRAAHLVLSVLLPFESVNVGSLLDIIEEVAARQVCEEAADDIRLSPETSPPAQPWQQQELWDFLEVSQPTQIALLMALASSSEPSVSSAVLASRMQVAAKQLPHIPTDYQFNAKTIGGARSGFSKRGHLLGKESFLDVASGRYRIKDDYKGWICAWLRERGLNVNGLATAGQNHAQPPAFEPISRMRLPLGED